MKKINISVFALLLIVFLSVQANAQVTFQVGAGGGYLIPAGDYGGTTSGFYSGNEYGMESGYNLHAKARLGLLMLNVFGEIGYSSFSGTGDALNGRGSLDVSNNIFGIKIGPELPISIPMSPITPYLQLFASYNAFSGTVDLQGISDVPSGEYDIESASRIGLGGGAGVVFNLMSLKLDLNIQYHIMNIAGKEYRASITSHERLDNYTALNDDKDPLYAAGGDHFIGDSRGIGAIEIKLSVMFGL